MSPAAPDSTPDQPTREDALAVLERLRQAGHIAYFAGGCVRDALLGHEPKDWDVATDAPPARVRELFSNTQAVGAAFGVILVRHRKSVIEVATFRTDLEYRDGRRPEGVQFATAQDDAKRRDFTINGLFYDPIEDRVIDFVGGQEDLTARRLRAIGNPDERFAEDHLRLLRAVRFAARFGFEIEPATADAIAKHADRLPRISPERIADELRRMLTPGTRGDAWCLLWELSLIGQLFRFFKIQEQGGLDEDQSIFLSLREPPVISFGLALAAATLDYSWQHTGRVDDARQWLEKSEISKTVRLLRQTLKISNEESDDLEGTLAGAGAMLAENEPGIAAKKRFLATVTAQNSRHLLDALAEVGQSSDRVAALRSEFESLEKTEFAPAPLITGDDLTASGMTPGPVFKRALDAAYDAQLEGRISSKEQAMDVAKSIVAGGTNPS